MHRGRQRCDRGTRRRGDRGDPKSAQVLSTTHVVGRPFQPGNPGRPKGSRHKATVAIEALLQGQAEGLTQKAIEKALGGDNFALKLCLDRLAPPRKDATVSFRLPKLQTAADALAALSVIADAVAAGEISPGEGAEHKFDYC